MTIFLMISAAILFIFGLLLLFAPGAVAKISDFLNRSAINADKEIYVSNRVSGTLFLLLSIALCYVILRK